MLDALAQGGNAPREEGLLCGEAKLMLGRFNDTMAVVEDNASAEPWRIRAIAHTRRKDPDQVLAAFEKGLGAPGAKARVAAPLDTDLLYFDALLAAKAKDWAKARDLLQPYKTSLESMPLANALYVEALLRLGQEDHARVRPASHLLREPDNRQVRLLLGKARLASDDAEGALEAPAPVAEWADASARARALLAEAEARASGG